MGGTKGPENATKRKIKDSPLVVPFPFHISLFRQEKNRLHPHSQKPRLHWLFHEMQSILPIPPVVGMGIFFFLKLSFGHKHTNARTSNKIRDRSSKYPLLLRAIQSGNHSLVVAALVVVVFPIFGSQLSITSLMTIIIIIRRPAPRVVEWVEEKEALFQITTQKVVKKKKENGRCSPQWL